jgi:carboxyl-terminal processing protease
MKLSWLFMLIALLPPFTVNAQNESTLQEDEKIYWLSRLWSEAAYNFAFFDQVPDLNWDDTYRDFIPQVLATKTDWEYYTVLRRFYALLHDGHTRVFPPRDLRNRYYGTATNEITTRLIEGRVIVTSVLDDALKTAGLKQGMEITAIDGHDVWGYADRFVAPNVSASTRQDMALQIYGHFLLSGDVSKPVKIEVKGFSGETRTFDVGREPWIMEEEVFTGEPFLFELLPDNIGYLKINNFVDTDQIRPKFDSIYTKILDTDGLVIDVRENFGGATQLTHYVLQRFATEKFPTVKWKSPMNIGAHRAWGQNGQWFEEEGYDIEPIENGNIYAGPVNLIVDESTFSGAEDFTLGFITINRGRVIGRKTAGSTGSPIMFELPGRGLALVCAKRDYFPDGREFVGLGITPDIEVKATIQDVIQNRDAALETALVDLKKRLPL